MLGFFADLLAKVGSFVATTSEIGCIMWIIADEPECPQSLIK